jgi:hypothetical protein
MTLRNLTRIAALLLLCGSSPYNQADQAFRISELSKLDQQYMSQQRELLRDLAAINLGRQFSGDKGRDIELLQALLDNQLVKQGQIRELQAMGVILGDLLAAEHGMHWVIYEDRLGRTRALRYRDSDDFLFPITMIARRREAGNQTPVLQIYQKASDIIRDSIPPLPFQ